MWLAIRFILAQQVPPLALSRYAIPAPIFGPGRKNQLIFILSRLGIKHRMLIQAHWRKSMAQDLIRRATRALRRQGAFLSGVMLTQSEEKRAAEAAQFWSESENNETIKDKSHWRGFGRYADDDVWLKIGHTRLHELESLLALAGRGPAQSMIEWGPGGGSNAVALAPTMQKFYGVDISQANLDECGRQLRSVGFTNYDPVLVDPANIDLVKDACLAGIEPVDFFLSVAVFQHFPSKAFGLEILSLANRLMKPDGVALIQIRYDDGSIRMRAKNSNYRENAMFFTSYKIDEFWIAAEERGFRPLALKLMPEVCYAYYFLAKAGSQAT
ncbi:methyltransferase domain-containing protein [Xanthobacter sp. KR7-225]|uniref:methyltransferase domain-containing protein n=1 Tax=Xanthobacter sp. KR7-225 TaxID=3156613 RepID=UPI0032B48047